MTSNAGLHSNRTQPKQKRIRRIFFRIAAIAVGCGFALVVCEVALRLFVDQECKRLAMYDPELGWRGRPNGSGVYIRKADGIRARFQYNNIGFRDKDVFPREASQRRVMLLGDSFIENLEVKFENTFPALVEKSLKQSSSNWESVVIGSQGYSTAQELLAFRKFKDLVDPDIVVHLFYCGNDFEDNLRTSFACLDEHGKLQMPPQKESWVSIQLRTAQRWLYETSHVVFLVKNFLQSVGVIDATSASKNAVDADEEHKREITSQLIHQLSKEVAQASARYYVVIIPFRDDLKQGKSDRPQFILNKCKEYGVTAMDLTDYLSAQQHYFATDIHFNTEGHQVVARAINDLIQNDESQVHVAN